MRCDAIIVAAGASERFGSGLKQTALLIDRPLLAWSVERLARHDRIDGVTVVAPPGREDEIASALAGQWGAMVRRIVPGGDTRQESVMRGLDALSDGAQAVLIHDAARPCATDALIESVVESLDEHSAVVPAVAARDTLVLEHDGAVDAVVDRVNVRHVQTPQVFRAELIVRAHRRAHTRGLTASDDGALVLALGEPVAIVDGDPRNIKITWPGDMVVAEAILREMR